MSVQKDCPDGATLGACWHANNTSKFLDKSLATSSNEAGLILADGTLMYIYLYSNQCVYNSTYKLSMCGMAYFDTNGWGKPNMWGKDIFGIWVLPTTIVPFGIKGDYYDTDTQYACDTSHKGQNCAAAWLMQ